MTTNSSMKPNFINPRGTLNKDVIEEANLQMATKILNAPVSKLMPQIIGFSHYYQDPQSIIERNKQREKQIRDRQEKLRRDNLQLVGKFLVNDCNQIMWQKEKTLAEILIEQNRLTELGQLSEKSEKRVDFKKSIVHSKRTKHLFSKPYVNQSRIYSSNSMIKQQSQIVSHQFRNPSAKTQSSNTISTPSTMNSAYKEHNRSLKLKLRHKMKSLPQIEYDDRYRFEFQ